MSRRTATALAVPLLLLVLAACTPADGDPDADGSGSGSSSEPSADDGAGPVLSSCVDGDWSADLADLAQQLGDSLAGNGMSVVSTQASGSQEVSIAGEGVIGYASDSEYVIAVDMGDGLTMTVTQHHEGTMGADWAWDGSAEPSDTGGTMIFENFDATAYKILNTTEMNGQVSETVIPVSDAGYGDVPMVVTCTGDTMTTQAQGSPFTTTWHRM
jgi:hypothetical protein